MYQTNIQATPPVTNPIGDLLCQQVNAPDLAAGTVLSLADVTAAVNEEKVKEVLNSSGYVTADELALSKTRRHAVEAENASAIFPSAGAPVWFGPAVEAAIQPAVQAAVQAAIQAAVQAAIQAAVEAALRAAVMPMLSELKMLYTKAWNSAAGDGLTKPWMEVPFSNGDNPSAAPHNLPAIRNVRDLNNLTAQQLAEYLVGYQQPAQRAVEARRKAVGNYIGYYG